MTTVWMQHRPALMPGRFDPENALKIWEQVLLLPAVQLSRWQNPLSRNQSISHRIVLVTGAEGNGTWQKKWSI